MNMTFKEHFAELRTRVIFCFFIFIIAFAICYFFSREIYNFLLTPFLESLENNQNHKLIFTNPTEAFFTYLKLSITSALFFSFPFFIAEFYLFISPGLYKKEKKFFLLIFFFSPFLFLCGAIFAYKFILPLAFKFFLSFENHDFKGSMALPIYLETRISEYLNFVTSLIFGFGISFQLPICLLFLIRIGLLSTDFLKRRRRYFIVAIFILSAILTPPDVLSQISLAILLIIFFEIVILVSKILTTKNN